MNKSFCDILIVGAGIIGLSLALSLIQSGIRVVIIDRKRPIKITNDNTFPDIRVSAINYNSMRFFEKINVWKNISEKFITSYSHMKTWECSSSVVTFHANSIKIPQMGCVLENNRLKLALWKTVENSDLITFYCSSDDLTLLQHHELHWRCILKKHNLVIYSYLLIGADGSNSKIRNVMKISKITWKHHQHCLLLTIKTHKNMKGTIWQVFTPTGPISFLPLYDNWGSLMWFNTPRYIEKLKKLSKSILEKKIECNFYKELGKITLHNVFTIPIINQRSSQYIGIQSVLVGDSAHTIHPLAGQGLNLGIRDVITLSKLLSKIEFFNINSSVLENTLRSYQEHRKLDIYIMQTGINWLNFIFHNNFLPLKIARNLAFLMIERMPDIKKQLLKYAALGI